MFFHENQGHVKVFLRGNTFPPDDSRKIINKFGVRLQQNYPACVILLILYVEKFELYLTLVEKIFNQLLIQN